MTGLQSNGHFVRQHLAAGDIHYGGKVNKALSHGDVGGIQRPDLVCSHNRHMAQQVG